MTIGGAQPGLGGFDPARDKDANPRKARLETPSAHKVADSRVQAIIGLCQSAKSTDREVGVCADILANLRLDRFAPRFVLLGTGVASSFSIVIVIACEWLVALPDDPVPSRVLPPPAERPPVLKVAIAG